MVVRFSWMESFPASRLQMARSRRTSRRWSIFNVFLPLLLMGCGAGLRLQEADQALATGDLSRAERIYNHCLYEAGSTGAGCRRAYLKTIQAIIAARSAQIRADLEAKSFDTAFAKTLRLGGWLAFHRSACPKGMPVDCDLWLGVHRRWDAHTKPIMPPDRPDPDLLDTGVLRAYLDRSAAMPEIWLDAKRAEHAANLAAGKAQDAFTNSEEVLKALVHFDKERQAALETEFKALREAAVGQHYLDQLRKLLPSSADPPDDAAAMRFASVVWYYAIHASTNGKSISPAVVAFVQDKAKPVVASLLKGDLTSPDHLRVMRDFVQALSGASVPLPSLNATLEKAAQPWLVRAAKDAKAGDLALAALDAAVAARLDPSHVAVFDQYESAAIASAGIHAVVEMRDACAGAHPPAVAAGGGPTVLLQVVFKRCDVKNVESTIPERKFNRTVWNIETNQTHIETVTEYGEPTASGVVLDLLGTVTASYNGREYSERFLYGDWARGRPEIRINELVQAAASKVIGKVQEAYATSVKTSSGSSEDAKLRMLLRQRHTGIRDFDQQWGALLSQKLGADVYKAFGIRLVLDSPSYQKVEFVRLDSPVYLPTDFIFDDKPLADFALPKYDDPLPPPLPQPGSHATRHE